jgi:hypothetical protein
MVYTCYILGVKTRVLHSSLSWNNIFLFVPFLLVLIPCLYSLIVSTMYPIHGNLQFLAILNNNV